MAAVLGGRVLLVAGGFSGVARGDLMAFKVPGSVLGDVPEGVSGDMGGLGGAWGSLTHIWGAWGGPGVPISIYGGLWGS